MSHADSILDFAVQKEEESAQFYEEWSSRVKEPGMKELLQGFAQEEKGHKEKILSIQQGKKISFSPAKIADLKIADYLVDPVPSQELRYQGALILAMKREKASFRMYSDLAGAAEDPQLRLLFAMLAQEEAKHKLRFEVEYDEHVLRED